MAHSLDSEMLDCLVQLQHAPASDVKKLGWRGLMKTIRSQGRLVVTNHDEPEAVIMSTTEYATLVQAAKQSIDRTETVLTALQQRFDERLAALNSPDAADRLRKVMRDGARLDGKVKAGTGH